MVEDLHLSCVKTGQVEAVPGEVEARDEEAGRVDDDDDDDDQVEVEELRSPVEWQAGLTVETRGRETVVKGNVGQTLAAVPVGVQQGHHQADQDGNTLTIETGECDVPRGVVNRGARSPHDIGELVREVDRHHVHPHKEADEGVVDGIAEEVADWREKNLLPIDEVKAPFDSVQQEIETNIQEESHHQLAEKVLS